MPGSLVATAANLSQSAPVPHGSIWQTAFRISADDRVVAFLSDVEYPDPTQPSPAALALAADADLLVHDAMYADAEYETHRGWGHSTPAAAIAVAEAAGARRLALFHHSPDATDAMIDVRVSDARARTDVPVFAAAEGQYLAI